MRKMPFYGQIKNHIFQWKAEKVFAAYCSMQKDGDYTLELSKTTCSKTNEQLGYFHGVIVETAYQQMLADGNNSIMISTGKDKQQRFKQIPLTKDVVVNLLKQVWATNRGVEVKSKADMTIDECSDLIDISIQWAERYLGCRIPPPEKTLV